MITIETSPTKLQVPEEDFVDDEAQLAAISVPFALQRPHAGCVPPRPAGVPPVGGGEEAGVVLAATRPHIELYRSWMEERGLAASTIDRRLSTVCGFYRFAHIEGESRRTRRSTCADRRCIRRMCEGWTALTSGCSSSPPSTTTGITPPSRRCSA